MADKADELRKQVQEQIVKIITAKLEEGEITQERAQQIAQMVLQQLPEGISYQRLIEVIPTLDDHFHELREAVVPIMLEYEQKLKGEVNQRLQKLLEAGKFDEAAKMAEKAIEYEKKLT